MAVTLPGGDVEYLVIHSDQDRQFVVDQFIVRHKLNGTIAKMLREGVLAADH